MPTDHDRIARQRSRPLLVELHRALTRLKSVLTVMNTGAHPDDEQSGMLAVLRLAYGMRTIVACSTRGEGGQNGLGPERGKALAVLRTREMEEAARVLDADVVWLGFGPDDPVHDFGFSKSSIDTLNRWGRERILERLVRAYRRERPDIVIPTFLDVPGQHGHHRAMTEAAKAAVLLAADAKAFPEHFEEGLCPWQVERFYLPAWSGGGGTYDDEVPPPNATVPVIAPGPDVATGADYAEIGEWSRTNHATQGMGRWSAMPHTEWPLHLALGPDQSETRIGEGLPGTVEELAEALESEPAATSLRVAAEAIAVAIGAFPDRSRIIAALVAAAQQVEAARSTLSQSDRDRHDHRLVRKLAELDAALTVAAGARPLAWIEPQTLARGGEGTLTVYPGGLNGIVRCSPRLPAGVSADPPRVDHGLVRFALSVANDAPDLSPFAREYSPLGGNGAAGAVLTVDIGGRTVHVDVDLAETLAIGPATSIRVSPEAIIQPLAGLPRTVTVSVATQGPPADVRLEAPVGVAVEHGPSEATVHLVQALAAGRHHIEVTADGRSAQMRREIACTHAGRMAYFDPTVLDVLALDLALPPNARVGYAGGGADRADLWMRRMGLDVRDVDAAALAADLSDLTTIVIGIFAFGLRPDLHAAAPKLRAWVEAGGHLVTLYHRPQDGWDPERTPPRRVTIGSPSLRWRVTDPAAAVDMLAQDHPLLHVPNRIGPHDWAGWDKERGLYFAKDWDPAYEPLLALHDPGEVPLIGSLLSARIEAGRHTHVALALHHQLDRLVPGAFRLMANLVQPAG